MKLDGNKLRLVANVEYCNINGIDYELSSLDQNDVDVGIGVNSSVFKAVRCDTKEDPAPSVFALKVCRAPSHDARSERFVREIKAMKLAAEGGLKFVVRLYDDGQCTVEWDRGPRNHLAILMEMGEANVRQYLEANDIPVAQRFLLSCHILKGLKELHGIGIYHRDIKPENIFFIGNECKIGDLGLIKFRDGDDSCDRANERIGPAGFMCPEAINKKYSIGHGGHSAPVWQVDGKSDVYQVAKLVWCILYGSIPNGIIKSNDLGHCEGRDYLYGNYFKKSLLYNKDDRPDIADALALFLESARGYM